jgi:hypothetical protein
MAYVYDGREALGHVIARGKLGFEAFGADDASLGVFPSQREAANAVITSAGLRVREPWWFSKKARPQRTGLIQGIRTVRHVSSRESRRKGNFDFCAKRRQEIVLHARLVGAADTDDFARWLIAFVWHNPRGADQIWSVMEAAKRMGGSATEAEASAITEEASITRKHLSADNLARFLGVTFEQRQRLGLTTIGSIDVKRGARKELRKRRWRFNAERRRRALGMRPQSQSLSRLKPWEAEGMTRRTWYRRNKAGTGIGTTLSTPIFLSGEDRPVPLARGATGLAERGFASKKVRCPATRGAPKAQYRATRGYPSSQTATTMAGDAYGLLPIELRLLALGLPLNENLRRAA